jgi:hypothetical protein
MNNKHLRSCSISLATREMQTKTTARHHFMPTRVTSRTRQVTTYTGRDVKKWEPSHTLLVGL